MKKSYEKHMEKKKMLAGKRIVGIDPAKEKKRVSLGVGSSFWAYLL